VLHGPQEVYRSFKQEDSEAVQLFLRSSAYRRLIEQELLIEAQLVDDMTSEALADAEEIKGRVYIRHPRLRFISYPYEWTAGMLHDAARCTLRVQSALMEQGYTLKDASAYNVQFDICASGPKPIFIDLGSVVHLGDTGGLWLPYRQFLSHFLLPLLLYQAIGYDFKSSLLADVDGLAPEQAYRILGPLRRLLPPYLTLVTLPQWLQRWEEQLKPTQNTSASSAMDEEKIRFILGHTIRSLRRRIDRLPGTFRHSAWQDYGETSSYPSEAKRQKADFVQAVCDDVRPETVLDLGCNIGDFSRMAAMRGATVLAVDSDMASLDQLYRTLQGQRTKILPLRVDIANPSPGIGWRNIERPGFLDRAGTFPMVFALAVVHHLLVTEGIPLQEIVAFLHRLTEKFLLVELVDSSDAMFGSLVRGRDALYAHMSLEAQEQAFVRQFSIIRSVPMTGMQRRLYFMEKR